MVRLDVGSDESVLAAKTKIEEMTDSLDILISNAGINGKIPGEVTMKSNYDYMMHTYSINSIGAVRLVEAFYEMMRESDVRRLCFVSSEAGSITQAQRVDNFSYCMSKAALNMYVKLIYNRLKPEGYSFRLYHPGWIRSYMSGALSTNGNLSIEEAARYAVDYFMDEIVDEWTALIDEIRMANPQIRVMFTVSPIRHKRDGLHANQLSKATLLLAADRLCQLRPEACIYFPSYEIMMDELRDYRFYADDMVHPTPLAVEYIWERFCDAFFDRRTMEKIAECRKIEAAKRHRTII